MWFIFLALVSVIAYFFFSRRKKPASRNFELSASFARSSGAIMQKKWITCSDKKVTPECKQNAKQRWIPIDQPFLSGDMFAPRKSNPVCRCDTGYREVNSKGKEV